MKQRLVRASLVIMAAVVPAAGFSQGVHWEARTTTASGDEGRLDRFYYMPRMMKMVGGDGGMAVIVRLDEELMTVIDSSKKSYYQVTFDEMEKMMGKASAMRDAQMEAMRQQLAALPEEQRKMAEEMMGSKMNMKEPAIKVTDTGETGTVAGYLCRKYTVTNDGEPSATVWATHDVKEFNSMKADMMEFSRRMKEMMKGMATETSGMMEGIEGFPVQTESTNGTKTVVTKMEGRSTPEREFEPPADFTKEKLPSMEEMPEGE